METGCGVEGGGGDEGKARATFKTFLMTSKVTGPTSSWTQGMNMM